MTNSIYSALVVHPTRPLTGHIGVGTNLPLPGDKSLSHRAALLAGMAEGESKIENFLASGVTQVMLSGLHSLGVEWRLEDDRLIVHGKGLAAWRSPSAPIDCGNSATTLRLLAGALASSGLPCVLDGSPGLRRRPMDRIVEPLRLLGAPISADEYGKAPLALGSRPPSQRLKPLTYALPVASAQVKSCLLLAGLAAEGEVVLIEPGPSRDHTERMLASLGVDIRNSRSADSIGHLVYITSLRPPSEIHLPPIQQRLPADISSAAFLIVAALVTPGSEIRLSGVGLNPTRTGIIDALLQMGAEIQVLTRYESGGEEMGDLLVRHSLLQGIDFRELDAPSLVVRMIDEFPAFSIAAAYARGRTVVCSAGELRHKESDRISALCGELTRLGVDACETPDGFIINGGAPPLGGVVESHGDHRLAMSFILAGLAARAPVTVRQAAVISESFPGFVQMLSELGARIQPGVGE